MAELIAIDGVVRNYPWGSRIAVPDLLGEPPTMDPVAEVWFGAHPDDPSPCAQHDGALDELVATDAVALLGPAVARRFDDRLPFLLKLLAAELPLSIQVHPNLAQARAGFAAEQARGIPRDSPRRNYRDANHKPEMIYALTPFDALCGFRPVEATLRLFDALAVDALDPVRALLAGPDGIRAAFTALLELRDPRTVVEAVTARAVELDAQFEGAQLAGAQFEGGQFDLSLRAVRTCAAAFPGDVGAVLSLLLNAVRLAPGEALYLGAGNVHAYLGGLGVEIMANSDNVLRCGLTGKHVDVDELLAITEFAPLAQPLWAPSAGGRFAVPVPDFTLSVLDASESSDVAVAASGPHIVLALRGAVAVEAGGETVELTPGRAVFVPDRPGSFTISGDGRVAIAGVGDI